MILGPLLVKLKFKYRYDDITWKWHDHVRDAGGGDALGTYGKLWFTIRVLFKNHNITPDIPNMMPLPGDVITLGIALLVFLTALQITLKVLRYHFWSLQSALGTPHYPDELTWQLSSHYCFHWWWVTGHEATGSPTGDLTALEFRICQFPKRIKDLLDSSVCTKCKICSLALRNESSSSSTVECSKNNASNIDVLICFI